jgi:SAM-dependent methyltransferase
MESGSTFVNVFSAIASQYAASRPTYPAALFQSLSSLAPATTCAWDCGTGNGQAATALAEFFDAVYATDVSAEQVEHARAHARVRYSVAAAERSCLPDQSIDLVSVAEALHWFDLERFYAEVRRVGRPGAVIAVYGYSWFYVSPEFDQLTNRLLLQPLQQFWEPNNRLLWDGYRTIPFPFQELEVPILAIHLNWSLDEIIAYYLTWSASRRKMQVDGDDFVRLAHFEFKRLWGDPASRRHIVMPIDVRAGRLP